jgi:hypothetical protein
LLDCGVRVRRALEAERLADHWPPTALDDVGESGLCKTTQFLRTSTRTSDQLDSVLVSLRLSDIGEGTAGHAVRDEAPAWSE